MGRILGGRPILKCSKEAFAACPTRHLCGCPEEAAFTEGSECDKFNRQIAKDANVLTNADRIRAMSDDELAAAIWATFNDNDYLGGLFCDGKAGCLLESGDFDCDDSKEKGCVLRWLKQPAENPVKWSKPGHCPVTPEQFDAVYDDPEA